MTSPYATDPNLSQPLNDNSINRLSLWSKDNGFKFLVVKTTCIHFSRLQGVFLHPNLFMDNSPLPFAETLIFRVGFRQTPDMGTTHSATSEKASVITEYFMYFNWHHLGSKQNDSALSLSRSLVDQLWIIYLRLCI
jgi:hypothetical protein